MRKFYLFFVLMAIAVLANAQSSTYTIFQGGGTLGFANEGYKGAFNGYALNIIMGKNFNEKGYLGIGVGNERLKGSYQTNDPHEVDQARYNYDQNLFPLFVDGRLPIGIVGHSSRIGMLANAGYAPRLSAMYDKGFLFKAGFFYLHESPRMTDIIVSANYGYQQLTKNLHAPKDFQHQHFNVSIGLMIK